MKNLVPRRAALMRQLALELNSLLILQLSQLFPFDVKQSTDEKYRENSYFPNTKQFVLSFFSLVVYDNLRLISADPRRVLADMTA